MRLLVISNNAFSMADSNGRTLAKHLSVDLAPEAVAQIYLNGSPDGAVCRAYYRISDRDVCRSLYTRRGIGGPVTPSACGTGAPSGKRRKKTPFRMLMRELIWSVGRWRTRELLSWIEAFAPTHILVFLADSAFLPMLARTLSRRYGLPVIAYTTEDYYFKAYNYLTRRPSLAYRLFHRRVVRAYRALAPYVRLCVLNTPMLRELYAAEFPFPCECLFTKSDISFEDHAALSDGPPVVSYLGNLGLSRHLALIELAEQIGRVCPQTRLDVYGPASEEVVAALDACPYIEYRGCISYAEVVRVMHRSDLLVHAERADAFYDVDLRAAFSTKIADSVSSGTPLLLYASEQLAVTQFLSAEGCAFVATTRETLATAVRAALTDEATRAAVVHRAEAARERFFSAASGSTLCRLIERYTKDTEDTDEAIAD